MSKTFDTGAFDPECLDHERIRLFSVQTSSSLCDLCGVYTGLSRASLTEEFTWADGTPYDYTSFWVTNEPGD